jgi:hypothetical protein
MEEPLGQPRPYGFVVDRLERMMASKARIEFVSDGFYQILNSQKIADLCKTQANRIASKAWDGFEAEPSTWHAGMGGGRVAATAYAGTLEAREAEANEKSLTKAVESCRA